MFLPVIAFNALYGWGGGDGQTSATYLLGRDTKAEKLGPFRIDLGPRIFRSVAARLLPTALKHAGIITVPGEDRRGAAVRAPRLG